MCANIHEHIRIYNLCVKGALEVLPMKLVCKPHKKINLAVLFLSHIENFLEISNLRLAIFETHSFVKSGWGCVISCCKF